MSFPQVQTVTIVTNASGDGTGYTSTVRGKIISISYVKTDYADTVDFTITTEDTVQNVWVEANVTAAKTVAPRQATHDLVGAASLYAAAGEPVEDHVRACGERIKIVVGSGGDTKTGAFRVIVE